MQPDFTTIIRQFDFRGSCCDVQPWGGGHINDTYALTFRDGSGAPHRYILQRINHQVFRNPEQVMHNVERVTGHLRRKVSRSGGDPDREALNLIPVLVPTTASAYLHRHGDGTYWRAYNFVEGARTYDIATDLGQVYQAGRAFGRFQQLVSDLPASELHETIPNFHHTPRRYEAFRQAIAHDAVGRLAEVEPEVAFVCDRADQLATLVALAADGQAPLRVTHNDTKLNNVLLDDVTGEGVCVIDLDTVMPGLAPYDFGDAVRSAANTAAEDEPDLGKVHFDLAIFDSLARGYLESATQSLTRAELDHLAFAARLLTLECGMRFLADFLNGDIYFRIHRPTQNLDRCRTQFRMVQEMEDRYHELVAIINTYAPPAD